jgi:hypothetical protein
LTADFTFQFSREHPSNLPRRLLALSPLRFAEAEKSLFWNETARRLSVPAEAVIPACATKKGADRDQRRDRSVDVSQHVSANLQPTITPSSSWQLSTSGYVRRVNHMYILSGHRQ